MLYRRRTRTGVVGHGARVRGRGAGAHRWKPAELSKQAIALHDVPTDQQQHMRSQHSTAVAARWRRRRRRRKNCGSCVASLPPWLWRPRRQCNGNNVKGKIRAAKLRNDERGNDCGLEEEEDEEEQGRFVVCALCIDIDVAAEERRNIVLGYNQIQSGSRLLNYMPALQTINIVSR